VESGAVEAGVSGGKLVAASGCRRFQSPEAASKEIFDGFNRWTISLTTYSTQAAYAPIAANWAVHGQFGLLSWNVYARLSVVFAISFLAVHMLIVWLMAHLYAVRCDYSDEDRERWTKEFEANETVRSPWPYTKLIEDLGTHKRCLQALLPLTSGTLFIFSAFT
jgi:hypothetical protein